jgi:hypothetical protein
LGAVAAVGMLHTVVPDHGAPGITLIARQHDWTNQEVAQAAGTGHIVSTLAIGLVVWIAGVTFATKFGGWIAISSLRALNRGSHHGRLHGHTHAHGRSHGPIGFHGPELARIVTDHDSLESGHSGDRVWVETGLADGARQRFEFVRYDFTVTVPIAHGAHVHSYDASFAARHDDPDDHTDDSAARPARVCSPSTLLRTGTAGPTCICTFTTTAPIRTLPLWIRLCTPIARASMNR